MVAAGRSPLRPALRRSTSARLPPDLVALRPEGFLWLGLLAVIATPTGRVVASLVGYLAGGERAMAVVSLAILAVIALSVALAMGTDGELMDLVILFVAFVVILVGAELFTNGIEWFGRKLELAEGAVGSVLAAVGTALPETMIPIIAILFATGDGGRTRSAIGAILGAPFMLVDPRDVRDRRRGPASAGAAGRHGDVMPVDTRVLAHDMRYFAIAYAPGGRRGVPAPRPGLAEVDRRGRAASASTPGTCKGHFEADPTVDAEDLAPLRFRRLDPRRAAARPGRCRACGSSTSRCSRPSA